ncbi:hypothetical protein LCGC14_2685750, partial [marine sediment metagenome]
GRDINKDISDALREKTEVYYSAVPRTDLREVARLAMIGGHRMQWLLGGDPLHCVVADAIENGELEVEIRGHRYVTVPTSERN